MLAAFRKAVWDSSVEWSVSIWMTLHPVRKFCLRLVGGRLGEVLERRNERVGMQLLLDKLRTHSPEEQAGLRQVISLTEKVIADLQNPAVSFSDCKCQMSIILGELALWMSRQLPPGTKLYPPTPRHIQPPRRDIADHSPPPPDKKKRKGAKK